MQSTTAQVVADSFVANWVARFGVPATITTDQGTQFTCSTWQCKCRAPDSKHVQTTAYHPQADGMVERFHRQLKVALHARCSRGDWLEHLPWVLLGLCAAPKEEAGVSAAEATYGHSLVLPSRVGQFWVLRKIKLCVVPLGAMILIQKPTRATHFKVLFPKNSRGQNIKNKK